MISLEAALAVDAANRTVARVNSRVKSKDFLDIVASS
jgi:hypothetical protein